MLLFTRLLCLVSLACAFDPTKIPGIDYTYKGHPYRISAPPTAGQGSTQFPLLAFFHALGMSGWEINGYASLIEAVNNAGYAVVTSFDRRAVPPQEGIAWVTDTIQGAIEQKIGNTNFSNVGIFGHSMGGGTVVHAMAAAPSNLNIKAGVALHPWLFEAPEPLPKQTHGPLMYTTGSKDTCVPNEPAKVRAAFEESPPPKIFANLDGATHFEPLNIPLGKHRWNPYVGYFFDCHLKGDESACTEVYATMGHDTNLPLTEFIPDRKGAPAPTPGPVPSPECGVTPKCMSAMDSCGRGSGVKCVACLGLKTPFLAAAGCPLAPSKIKAAMSCFCHSEVFLV